MNLATIEPHPRKSAFRIGAERSIHPSSFRIQPPFTPRSPQTPSLPDAEPRSDRPQCGGRESKFLAVYLKLFHSVV